MATHGVEVVADVTVLVHPLASWIPAVRLHESAVAALEPGVVP